MIAYGDLRSWRAEAVGRAGEQLRADLHRLELTADAVRGQAVPGSWWGLAAMFARARQQRLVSTMDAHVEGARAYVTAIFNAEGTVSAIETLVQEIDGDAAAQQFSVGADGTVTDTAGRREFESQRAADAYTAQRTAARDALVDRVTSVLETADEVDSALEDARPDDAFADGGPQGVADPRVARDWAAMSTDERRAVLEDMAEDLADEYGLDDFTVNIEDLEDQDGDGVDDDPSLDLHGYWSESDRGLYLDSNELDDPSLINTMAHEVRHAAQNELARDADPGWLDQRLIDLGVKDDPWDPPAGVTREEAREWGDNFDDYQVAEDDFDAYYNQPVEVDARDSGEEYLDDLDAGDLAEHRREAG
ncbi:hypothetical protein GCM10027062_12960 [Nocardioides hungaricus]